MDAETAKTLIAGYAAIVSTITLVWNIINSINQNKSKIKVFTYFTTSFEHSPMLRVTSEVIWNLTIDIINHSKYKKYIEQPLIKFPEMIDGENKFKVTDLKKVINYPQELEPGQKFQTDIRPCESLLNLINQLSKDNLKFQVLIKDTQGKEYFSKKIKLKDLKAKCEVNISKKDLKKMEC